MMRPTDLHYITNKHGTPAMNFLRECMAKHADFYVHVTFQIIELGEIGKLVNSVVRIFTTAMFLSPRLRMNPHTLTNCYVLVAISLHTFKNAGTTNGIFSAKVKRFVSTNVGRHLLFDFTPTIKQIHLHNSSCESAIWNNLCSKCQSSLAEMKKIGLWLSGMEQHHVPVGCTAAACCGQ